MVNSMSRIGFFEKEDRELVIVNNGKQNCKKDFEHIKNLVVVNCPENRGWEGGLIEGLKVARGEFVCFQNDDVHIPQAQSFFYEELLAPFESEKMEKVGIVAPTTTCAAGIQSVFHQDTPVVITEVTMLIFLCVMMRRSVLDEVGGVDESLPGGDDIDLSIRMRMGGYKLYVNPNAFIIHYGFTTGNRVNGDHTVDGGWNSQKMQDRTNKALIQKHGFRTWMETMRKQIV
jgi:GT2 family glycosyltransferase